MKRFEALKIQAALKNLEEVGSISTDAFNEVKQFTNINKPPKLQTVTFADHFKTHFDLIMVECHRIACSKGWHDKPVNDGEQIALMHSELSEALEWLRHGNRLSDHIPAFTGLEEELADVIIRIMDFSCSEKPRLRIAEAIIAKMEYNRSREFKHGGKKF